MIHFEDAKREKWSSLGTYQQGAARFIAYSYAGDLFHVVTVVEAMLRDRTLDDRGVQMKILTARAPIADLKVPRFRAAKIRLR